MYEFYKDALKIVKNLKKENEQLRIESVQPVCDLLNELSEEKEIYKMLWEQMSYYFRDGAELKDLDHKDFRTLQRLSKGLVD